MYIKAFFFAFYTEVGGGIKDFTLQFQYMTVRERGYKKVSEHYRRLKTYKTKLTKDKTKTDRKSVV